MRQLRAGKALLDVAATALVGLLFPQLIVQLLAKAEPATTRRQLRSGVKYVLIVCNAAKPSFGWNRMEGMRPNCPVATGLPLSLGKQRVGGSALPLQIRIPGL
jgi:hypothetical protein